MIRPINPGILETLRELGGIWYAYQNQTKDSCGLGHIQFLKCSRTSFRVPPTYLPDMRGIGWKYSLIGKVNLEHGVIEDEQETRFHN